MGCASSAEADARSLAIGGLVDDDGYSPNDPNFKGRDLVEQDAIRIYDLVDKDSNGMLDPKELHGATDANKVLSEEGQLVLKTDLSDFVSRGDFIFMMRKLNELDQIMLLETMEKVHIWDPLKANAQKLFELLDENKNGVIDLNTGEAAKLDGFPGKIFLQQMDYDKDGAIDANEFTRAMQKKATASPERTRLLLKAAINWVANNMSANPKESMKAVSESVAQDKKTRSLPSQKPVTA